MKRRDFSARLRTLRKISKATAREVHGGKRKNGATPRLYESACKGTHIPEVVIE